MDHTNEEVDTALHLAAAEGHDAIVRALLEARAEVEHEDEEGCTALHIAARYGGMEVARALLEAEADVNHAAVDGSTPLSAAKWRQAECLRDQGRYTYRADAGSVIEALLQAGATEKP